MIKGAYTLLLKVDSDEVELNEVAFAIYAYELFSIDDDYGHVPISKWVEEETDMILTLIDNRVWEFQYIDYDDNYNEFTVKEYLVDNKWISETQYNKLIVANKL